MSLSLHPMDMSFAMRRMSKLHGSLPACVSALTAWAHGVVRGPARTSPPERRTMPFPTDNWLREDIWLLPLADSQPPLHQRPTPQRATYFPTDNHLRDDIGLPPITADSGAFCGTVAAHRRPY